MHCSRRPSLVSLENESQVSDDGDDADSDDEEEEEEGDFDDDRSSSVASSAADRSEVCDDTCTDGTATPVWHQMLHTLNKVRKGEENVKVYLF